MDYQQINKDSWNKRTDAHWESGFYDVQGFLDGKSSLNDIELSLLGNIQGKNSFTCNAISDRIPFPWEEWAQT